MKTKLKILLRSMIMSSIAASGSTAIYYTFYDSDPSKVPPHKGPETPDSNPSWVGMSLDQLNDKIINEVTSDPQAMKALGVPESLIKLSSDGLSKYAKAILNYGLNFDDKPLWNDKSRITDPIKLAAQNKYFSDIAKPTVADLSDASHGSTIEKYSKELKTRLITYMSLDIITSSFILIDKTRLNQYFNPGSEILNMTTFAELFYGNPSPANQTPTQKKEIGEINASWTANKFDPATPNPSVPTVGSWLNALAKNLTNVFGITETDFTENVSLSGGAKKEQLMVACLGDSTEDRDLHTIDLFIPSKDVTFQDTSNNQININANPSEFVKNFREDNTDINVNHIKGDILKISLPIWYNTTTNRWDINVNELSWETPQKLTHDLVTKLTYDGSGSKPVVQEAPISTLTTTQKQNWTSQVLDTLPKIKPVISGVSSIGPSTPSSYNFIEELVYSVSGTWDYKKDDSTPSDSPKVAESMDLSSYANSLHASLQETGGKHQNSGYKKNIFSKQNILDIDKYVRENFIDVTHIGGTLFDIITKVIKMLKPTSTDLNYGELEWDFPKEWYHDKLDAHGDLMNTDKTELVFDPLNEWLLSDGDVRTAGESLQLLHKTISLRTKWWNDRNRDHYVNDLLAADSKYTEIYSAANFEANPLTAISTIENSDITDLLSWIRKIPGVDIAKLDRVIGEAKAKYNSGKTYDIYDNKSPDVYNQLGYVMAHFIFDVSFDQTITGKIDPTATISEADWKVANLNNKFAGDGIIKYSGVIQIIDNPTEGDNPLNKMLYLPNQIRTNANNWGTNAFDFTTLTTRDILYNTFGDGAYHNKPPLTSNSKWENVAMTSLIQINPTLLLMFNDTNIDYLIKTYGKYYSMWELIAKIWNTSNKGMIRSPDITSPDVIKRSETSEALPIEVIGQPYKFGGVE